MLNSRTGGWSEALRRDERGESDARLGGRRDGGR